MRKKNNGLAEEIMAKNFLNLVKDGSIQIHNTAIPEKAKLKENHV